MQIIERLRRFKDGVVRFTYKDVAVWGKTLWLQPNGDEIFVWVAETRTVFGNCPCTSGQALKLILKPKEFIISDRGKKEIIFQFFSPSEEFGRFIAFNVDRFDAFKIAA
jgi:hypothetical protein